MPEVMTTLPQRDRCSALRQNSERRPEHHRSHDKVHWTQHAISNVLVGKERTTLRRNCFDCPADVQIVVREPAANSSISSSRVFDSPRRFRKSERRADVMSRDDRDNIARVGTVRVRVSPKIVFCITIVPSPYLSELPRLLPPVSFPYKNQSE